MAIPSELICSSFLIEMRFNGPILGLSIELEVSILDACVPKTGTSAAFGAEAVGVASLFSA